MDFIFFYVFQFFKRFLGTRDSLPENSKNLIWLIGLYDFNFALSSVFTNIFLFKKQDDWDTVELFNLVMYAAILLAFWAGGHLAKRVNHLLPYRLGFVFNAMVFLFLLLLREHSPEHPCFLGFLAGLGIGFYYLGQHSLTLDLTEAKTRDYFLSLSLFLSSILRILAPALAGWIIQAFRPEATFPRNLLGIQNDSSAGYYFVFAMSLLVYLLLIYKSFKIEIKPVEGTFEFWKVLTFKENGDWNRQMWAQFVLGLRNGVFWFIIGVLVYRASKSEAMVGSFNMMSNFLAVLTAYGLSLWAASANRNKGMWMSSWLTWAACVLLAWKINTFSLLVYAVLNAVGVTWFQVAFGAIAFEVVEGAKEAKRYKLEYLAVRELPLWVGRTIGLGALMACQHWLGESGLRLSLLVLGFTHMGVFLCLPKKIKVAINRHEHQVHQERL